MAALGGGRSTLANQSSLYHVSWRPRLPDDYRAWAEKTGRNSTNWVWNRYSVKSHSTCEFIQFFSICFIVNRPKAKQIKWVKSDPVSAAFFLGKSQQFGAPDVIQRERNVNSEEEATDQGNRNRSCMFRH